jgi:hypothetical protein
MKRLLIGLLALSCFGADIFIDAGKSRFGNTSFTLSNQVHVVTTGVPSVATPADSYIYFDAYGQLDISLPPGVSGTCSGAPCNVFTTHTGNAAAHYIAGSHQLATATQGASLYWIDPIFNTTTSQSGAYTLEANAPVPLSNETFAAGAYETDVKFQSTQNGFILGMRFYRVAADTDTAPIGTLYTDTGTSLASKVFPVSGTGWQTVLFDSPVAITAGTWYRASKFDAVGSPFRDGVFVNASLRNNALVSASTYVDGNNVCDSTNVWPQTATGYGDGTTTPSAGIIGCVRFGAAGDATITNPGNGFSAGQVGRDRFGTVEGCQCMLGGEGPGPYAGINTLVEGSGNMWHHDDGGRNFAGLSDATRFMGNRGDYYYYRMTWRWPDFVRLGSAASDGFRYNSRQALEWKGGNRIYIGGSIFEGMHNDKVNSALTISFGNQTIGASDINFENNEVRHVPGWSNLGDIYNNSNGASTSAPIQARMRVYNNLFWDFGAYGTPDSGIPTGRGWLFEDLGGSEDMLFDHNTVLPMRGDISTNIFHLGMHTEGNRWTNNVLPISNPGRFSNWGGGGSVGTDPSCGAGEKNITTCVFSSWSNYVFSNNVLYPAAWSITDATGFDQANGVMGGTYTSAVTASQVATQWPTLAASNFIPASSTLSTYGWFGLPSLTQSSATYAEGFVPKIKSGSMLSAGNHATYPSTDGKDLGVNVQKLLDAQGRVDVIGTPANLITTTGATVVFNAPDTQGCPVDFKAFDAADPNTLSGFTRVADAGTGRTRSVALTGLTTGTAYQYRIDCAEEQPTGIFRTH